MCGIAGYTTAKSKPYIQPMIEALYHRGPDDQGTGSYRGCTLGMRRLSIVDIDSGQQPMANSNSSIHSVFNGEIYNHRQLRKDLIEEGFRFRSDHADSEVIPHLYEKHGLDFLEKLNGMFAIAIWDEVKQDLHLARDHAGIKPLYYGIFNNQLIFGSEIKALFHHPDVKREPNIQAINHYFSFKNIPAPLTAFEGIYQLLPGEVLTWRNGDIQKRRWWHLPMGKELDIDENEAKQEIRSLLEDSVEMQMQCDVPFGAYLSGGIDSSAVVAIMSKKLSRPVKTFTLTYEDNFSHKQADQIAAKKVSDLYQTEHYEYCASHCEIESTMTEVVKSFDQPFSGVTSTYFLTQLISKHVKVALSGDGADELFASYLPHRLALPLHHLDTNGGKIKTENMLPFTEENFDFVMGVWSKKTEASRRMRQYLWTDDGKEEIYSDWMTEEVNGHSSRALVESLYQECNSSDPLNRALFVDFNSLLPDQVLSFVDTLSMAHSVEVRPPFLDHRIIEFAARLPGSMKIKNGRVKHILKEAVADLLPAELIDRPKEGFVLPVNQWLTTSLKEQSKQLLAKERLARHGIFNENAVRPLIEGVIDGKIKKESQLWNLMMFQIWWERFFE